MEKRENFSQKRMAILNVLQKTTVHPTAEWVYETLQPQYPNLSLGTVYRNLKRFCAEGKAVSVGVIDGQEHFDGTVTPHAHFICNKCGAVLDIQRNFFGSEALQRLSESTGRQVESASITFRGVCEHCRKEA
ncbi:Fur family transcriptional regulator [uncultured Neglectibacter sp.]|uniref:Fur family transcriptional regulator n=1 Tax=uncultured Neglectibacter sp. TaxID=1924108 RepID=UPI0034DE208B